MSKREGFKQKGSKDEVPVTQEKKHLPSTETMLSLLGLLYDAAVDNSKWAQFLTELCEVFEADGAQFNYYDGDGIPFMVVHNHPVSVIPAYTSYLETDPRHYVHVGKSWHPGLPSGTSQSALKQFAQGKAHTSHMIVDDDELKKTEVYQKFLIPLDIESSMGSYLPNDDGTQTWVALTRGKTKKKFTTPESELFDYVTPHIKRAVQIHKRLAQMDLERRTAILSLDNINMGLILINDELGVLYKNNVAEGIIAQQDGIEVIGHKVGSSDRSSHLRFQTIVREVVRSMTDNQPSRGRALSVKRVSGVKSYSLLVSPIAGHLMKVHTGNKASPIIAIYVSDPELTLPSMNTLLQELYGLTPMEGQVLANLVKGLGVTEQAELLEVQSNTIRAHLKSIFAKTNTASQNQLIHLVMNNPIYMGLGQFEAESAR